LTKLQHEKFTDVVGQAFAMYYGPRARSQDPNEVSNIGCAATMIVVKDGFVDPDMLVEIEADAVVDQQPTVGAVNVNFNTYAS
jgi:hypothetical protein